MYQGHGRASPDHGLGVPFASAGELGPARGHCQGLPHEQGQHQRNKVSLSELIVSQGKLFILNVHFKEELTQEGENDARLEANPQWRN